MFPEPTGPVKLTTPVASKQQLRVRSLAINCLISSVTMNPVPVNHNRACTRVGDVMMRATYIAMCKAFPGGFAAMASAMGYTYDALNRLTSAFNFSWSFGTGISPYIASFLVTVSPAFALVFGAGLFAFIAAFVALGTLSCPHIRAIRPEREYIQDLERNDGAVDHSTPLRYDSWIAVFVVYSALSVVLNIFPMYAGEVAGMGETTSGFLLLLRGLATCAAFMTLGRMRFWQFKAWMIYLAQGMFVVLALVFHSASTPLSTGVFFILFGIVFALCYSFSIFHAAAGALDRGRRMVIHECVLTVGQVVGASFGGVIYQSMGYSDVLLFLAATATLLLAVQVAVHVFRRRA